MAGLIRGLLRRWYIVVLGLLLTSGAGSWAFSSVPPKYEATATMLLLPPEDVVGVEGSNPYLVLGGLGQALSVLDARVNAQDTRAELLSEAPPDTSYTVFGDSSSGAPFLHMTVESESSEHALELLEALQDTAGTELAAMQDDLGIEGDSLIEIVSVTSDTTTTSTTSERAQLTTLSIGLGLVLTLAIAAATDAVIMAFQRRRAAASDGRATSTARAVTPGDRDATREPEEQEPAESAEASEAPDDHPTEVDASVGLEEAAAEDGDAVPEPHESSGTRPDAENASVLSAEPLREDSDERP